MSIQTPTEDEIFHIARGISDPDTRSAYLHQACGSNTELFERIVELLRVTEDTSSFLENPPPGIAPTVNLTRDYRPLVRPGQGIGPYKIREQIGDGGMGVVFVAEQEKPLRRKVALKVIKPGMDSKAVLARFDAERNALALMNHPNIAKVLDAGTTEQGHPYFVMELIQGKPITEYCDQKKLTIKERLELFTQICNAVQHAHSKGVIHRDIKPNNILVTEIDGKPIPKVIDFGVAKALGANLTDRTVYTSYQSLVGTPLYMSPEQTQLSGVDVDTSSDVYSLGILLYELLTGTTPLSPEELKQAAQDEALRRIRETEPPRPSNRISSLGESSSQVSECRGAQPEQLGRLVRGDLDWIVMKALEKDRNRRYKTADAFAADIGRHLTSEPVEARPPSAGYRLSRFYRRNRTFVGMATFVVGISVIAAVAGTTGWITAKGALARLEQVARIQAIEAALNLDPKEMRSAIKTAREAGASEGWEKMVVAISQLFGGEPKQAVATLKEAQRLGEDTVAVRSLLSEAYMYCGDMDSMLEVELLPEGTRFMAAEDQLFLAMPERRTDQLGAFRLATEAFEQTRSPVGLLVRASVYGLLALDTGNLEYDLEAIADATAALRLLPSSAYARATCARAYDGARRRAKMIGRDSLATEYELHARLHADVLFQSPASNPWFLAEIGFIFDDLGDMATARECFSRAADKSDNQNYFVQLYVNSIVREGDMERAEQMIPLLEDDDTLLAASTLSQFDSMRELAKDKLLKSLKDARSVPDDRLLAPALHLGVLFQLGYPTEAGRLAREIVESQADSDEISFHVLRYFAGLEDPNTVLEIAGDSRVQRGQVLLAWAQFELGHRHLVEAERRLEESVRILQGLYFYERSKYLLDRINDPSRHAEWWKTNELD
ncbi:serine/threonine protein kinase [Stieleria sp. ICT_E10.1]|uniref:serine/threonine protein kinase n=1 Tax=Stieleria sedimenti TaxID=2976331 RepID=UPI00217FCDA9|nr:serine/threonine protein kinase [Stieleria sedimenti]MCS7471633.1 serine/threonine protein kinase [Stieleria sedimenti]